MMIDCIHIHLFIFIDLCTVALARGYDSIQIKDNAEVVVCRAGGCATTTYNGTCPPLELRTGYNASRVCNCSEDMRLLNCGVDIHTGMAPEKQHPLLRLPEGNKTTTTQASSSSSSSMAQDHHEQHRIAMKNASSYRQRPFTCIAQKIDPPSSLSFELLVIFSSGLTSNSESAQFIIGAINKSVEAQHAANNEHDDDGVTKGKNIDGNSKKTSHKQNGKVTSKANQHQHPQQQPPPPTQQYSLFIDYYRTGRSRHAPDIISIQHVKGFAKPHYLLTDLQSHLDRPFSFSYPSSSPSSSSSSSASSSSSGLFSLLPHRRHLEFLLRGSVNSLLVKDRMGVLSIGIVRFRYPNVVSHHFISELFHPSIDRSIYLSIILSIYISIYPSI